MSITEKQKNVKFLLIDKNRTDRYLGFEKKSSNLICDIKIINCRMVLVPTS